MINALPSSITQSVPVSVNDLESKAIREQRRFLLPFSKKGRGKQSYSLTLKESMETKI
ncbi:hypothetical protein ACLHDG_12995 [Sulfurovum sp. CS9]|uniref:hypothetical protein n=1 Tax=Sulfurovum sp. CS9 TaxID=3391146 RepID=UPI0039EC59ED